ncbi:DNA-binding protein, partial [Ruixingdingia sedimenti]
MNMARATQEFFTAQELADIAKARGITTFPNTKRNVNKWAEREGWNGLGPHRCRKRAGRGGGLEYHFTLLPEPMIATIFARDMRQVMLTRHDAAAEADRRQLAAVRVAALPAHARKVMEARAEILLAIEGYAIASGHPRSWATARFMEAQAAYADRQQIERRRDNGEPLSEREIASLGSALKLTAPDGFQLAPACLANANDRRSAAIISERTLRRWFKARDERGALALAPTPPKQEEAIPAGFYDFLKFWALPGKPSVPEAYKDYTDAVALRQGAQPMTVTLDQVRHTLKHKIKGLDKYVGREGLLTLRSRMAYVTRTTEDMWPTTIYTADGKTFDAEVADPVSRRPMRPEITSVLDVATRKCVGYAVSRKENVIAVTEALRRSCSTHGICAIF